MKVALGQINPTIGDFDGNRRLVLEATAAAEAQGADLVLPELNGAQRQRRMIDAGATPFEVFKQSVEETRATYPAKEKAIQ